MRIEKITPNPRFEKGMCLSALKKGKRKTEKTDHKEREKVGDVKDGDPRTRQEISHK